MNLIRRQSDQSIVGSTETAKWIGVDTVSVDVYTTLGATTTVTASFAIVTATAASGNINAGDVRFITSPQGNDKLNALFEEVAAACANTHVKRSGSCELSQLSRPGAGGVVLEFDIYFDINIPMFTAGDVAVALQSVPAAVAVAFIAYVIGDGKVPDSVKIPATDTVKTTKTTTTSTTETGDLAPYVTTNYPEVVPTETLDSDALDSFMQNFLLSFFPTSTNPGAMPTLTKATTITPGTISISTPAGSSCAKTITTELCTIPWEPCATSPPLGQVTCFPESRRPFDKYGAVRPDRYEAAVDKACAAFASKGKLDANEGRGSYVYQAKDGSVPYWFNIGVGNGYQTCENESLDDPVGDGSHKCSTILKNDIFLACNNGGRGGFLEVGCLTYAFDVCSGNGDIPLEGACFTIGMGAPWVVT
ncbi:glycoside hydrolase family 55 protein [Penicillium canariense]|uniref:Glycoside hydrolase family 55 protein n=1 Tax=Penicillium canariense TaxID=189055 RepID=A0A9W9HLL7_9EURO|nr:glycoside hydrolase family 55 protein [Penicillium canariense]KAJ5151219.1 glycoside hydrolase family 55 protein [Penicillium canariense]